MDKANYSDMQRSPVFSKEIYPVLEERIKEYVNHEKNFLSARTVNSPRAVGDALQDLLEEKFGVLVSEYVQDYSANFARRAMADLAFTDKAGFYNVVDIKTHRLDTKFNMPNLTSVERLARFYEDDKNTFSVLTIAYNIEDDAVKVAKVHFVPIEYLSWECLTLGALGWGQIQIANSNNIIVKPEYSRKKWMIELCDELLNFYPLEMEKIAKRMEYFKKVQEKWQGKSE